jgi:hypothetical protein
MWIGYDDEPPPCDQPCMVAWYGSLWNEEDGCWQRFDPVMCIRSSIAGTIPAYYQVPGVGILLADHHGALLQAFDVMTEQEAPEGPFCHG